MIWFETCCTKQVHGRINYLFPLEGWLEIFSIFLWNKMKEKKYRLISPVIEAYFLSSSKQSSTMLNNIIKSEKKGWNLQGILLVAKHELEESSRILVILPNVAAKESSQHNILGMCMESCLWELLNREFRGGSGI